MSAQADRLGVLIAPVLAELELSLYDLDYSGGNLRVLIDRPGGIDLGAITQATRRISNLLDEADIITSAYTLEVSSPGLERNLRTPAHFASAIGREVKIKTRPSVAGERRVDGTLIAADDSTCEVRSEDGSIRVLQLSDIERARTHFVGDAAPKPGKGSRPGSAGNKSSTAGKKPSKAAKKPSPAAKKSSKTQPSGEED
jgi:ribosome maturation factor RimP